MIETFLEYSFASSMYRELVSARNQIAVALNKRKGDIQLTATLARIDSDLKATAKVIENYRPIILHHMQQKHGIKFQWLIQPVNEPKLAPGEVVQMTPTS